jgi:hypothetical protein
MDEALVKSGWHRMEIKVDGIRSRPQGAPDGSAIQVRAFIKSRLPLLGAWILLPAIILLSLGPGKYPVSPQEILARPHRMCGLAEYCFGPWMVRLGN